MSKMRLTTLNLDEDCLEILGTEKNKSRYARECIKLYHTVVEDLDHMEERAIKNNSGMRALARYLVDEFNNGDDYVLALMANWCDMTPAELLGLGKYAEDAIMAASIDAAMA